MDWQILDTGAAKAEENMQLDAELLDSLEGRPILHFYDWQAPSCTYGHFVKLDDYVDREKAELRGLQTARRPTGGGIVFHEWDFAFSVLIPSSHKAFSLNTLQNYAVVNGAVLRAARAFLSEGISIELIDQDVDSLDLKSSRFCMARPTKYDVMLGGKKIAGAAQRKTKAGFLHQGTIALQMPPQEKLQELLIPGSRVIEAIQAHTFPLLGEEREAEKIEIAKKKLRLLLYKHITTL